MYSISYVTGYPGIHGRSRDRNPVPYVANDLTDVDIITSNLNQNHRWAACFDLLIEVLDKMSASFTH